VGQDPSEIRQDIEHTRAQMGETVDALSYKTDVKSRAKDSLQDKKESAKESVVGATRTVKEKLVGATESVSGTTGSATARVGEAAPDKEQVKHQARRAKGLAQENPIGLAIGSIAVGFLAGLIVPATRVEDEKLGEASDQVIEKAKETGQEALEHGKQVVQEAAQSAKETAQQSGQEHAEQLKQSAQESAQEVTPSS
jgi:Protein of unknown function (DUF3618)